jgi:hypothetical protein
MQADGNGPMVGHAQNDTLGVREKVILEDGREVGDVRPIDGVVQPDTGGMSVSPSVQYLPPHLIPKNLRNHGYPAARRSTSLPNTFPWHMGEGDFAEGAFCDQLYLRLDVRDDNHGLVEPVTPATLEAYRSAVEATHPQWIRAEW